MQITPAILSNTLLQNVQNQEAQISQLQEEESTGQSFQLPSDNPTAAETTLSLNNSLDAINGYTTSAQNAEGWLNQTIGVLTNMISLMDQAIQTATQAANSTNDQSDLNDLAQSISSDQSNLGQMLNTQYEGSYLFGGYNNETPPVSSSGVASLPTGTQSQTFAINSGATVTVNLTGNEAVGQPNGQNYLEQAYNDLGTLATAIQQGPAAAQQMLTSLQSDYSNLTGAQGLIGGRLDRVQNTLSQLQNASADISQSIATVSGANMAQVTTQLAQEEDSYQAALQSGSQVLSLSLLNFINT